MYNLQPCLEKRKDVLSGHDKANIWLAILQQTRFQVPHIVPVCLAMILDSAQALTIRCSACNSHVKKPDSAPVTVFDEQRGIQSSCLLKTAFHFNIEET